MILSLVNFTTYKISEDFLEKIIKRILKEEGIKKDYTLEVVLLGQRKMRSINKRYMGTNRVTDVLSFPFLEVAKTTKRDLQFIEPKETEKSLGEILLCPSKIKRNAKKFKKGFKEELTLVFIHGILHLLGYDHKNKEMTKRMRRKEEEILKEIYSN
jgi:probable rRNA maturation factor